MLFFTAITAAVPVHVYVHSGNLSNTVKLTVVCSAINPLIGAMLAAVNNQDDRAGNLV